MTASTAFSTETGKITAESIYYGVYSPSRSIQITRNNCLVTIDSIPDTYGDITINYTLTNDRETTCSIRPYYSINGGTSFSEALKSIVTSGDAKTGLSTSVSGTAHTFEWDTYGDLGVDYVGDIVFKLRAYDRDNYIGDYTESQTFIIGVDNAPSASTLSLPTDVYFQKDDTPLFQFVIPTNNNPEFIWSKLHIKLEVDVTDEFNSDDLEIFESRLDQTGWEYQNIDDSWTAIPEEGFQNRQEMSGNLVRFVVPSDRKLKRTTVYWRISFGGVADGAIILHEIGMNRMIRLIGV